MKCVATWRSSLRNYRMFHHSQPAVAPSIPTTLVAVLYNQRPTDQWVKIMHRSLRKHLDTQLVCVDNNPENPIAANWLREQGVTVLAGHERKRSHGSGLDILADWCRGHGQEIMVAIEPDCLIEGAEWFNNLIGSIEAGASMASGHLLAFGPLHPCPSAWKVADIPGTFDFQARGPVDPKLVSYTNLVKWLNHMEGGNPSHHLVDLFFHQWDCGLGNWYKLVEAGLRADLVSIPDFHHFFSGSARNPTDLPAEHYEWVKPLLG